jgi:hypothetical protein
MALEVNRQIVSAKDFYLLSRDYPRNLLAFAFGLRRSFHFGVTATRLYQTANQGQSRPVFRLDLPAAGRFARALENHAFPTSALQSVKITLPAAVSVQGQLDARAASRQGGHAPIFVLACRSMPQ